MSLLSTQNAELLEELQRYAHVPAVGEGIRSALGARAGDGLSSEDFPVRCFFFTATAELLQCYFVTRQRFILFEMLADGTSLTVATPLARVCRVSEVISAETVLVSVELDADITRVVSRSEAVSGSEVDAQGQPTGRSLTNQSGLSEVARAKYDLSAVVGTDAALALREFSRRARLALE